MGGWAKKARDKNKLEVLKTYIDKITKDFDRQMLEDLITDWEKDRERKNYVKYLKKKRNVIKWKTYNK